jgi:hypothetical protein
MAPRAGVSPFVRPRPSSFRRPFRAFRLGIRKFARPPSANGYLRIPAEDPRRFGSDSGHLVADPSGIKLGSDRWASLRALRATSMVFCSSSVYLHAPINPASRTLPCIAPAPDWRLVPRSRLASRLWRSCRTLRFVFSGTATAGRWQPSLSRWRAVLPGRQWRPRKATWLQAPAGAIAAHARETGGRLNACLI